MVQSFKDLAVWEKSIELCERIYSLSDHFPASEKYGLTSQIKKAAVSIPSNIAEGSSRQTTKEFIQFLYISNGSISEVETQLELAKRFNYINNSDIPIDLIKQIRKMITNLIKALKAKTT